MCVSCCRAEGGRRRGYMGHLTRITNSVVHNSDKGPNGAQIQQLLSGEWALTPETNEVVGAKTILTLS